MDWFLYDIGLRHERVKKHLNQHIIYHNYSFLIEKSFWNLSNLLHNLTYLLLLNSFLFLGTFSVFLKTPQQLFFQMAGLQVSSVLINCTMWSSYLFLHPAFSHVFHSPGFLRVQVFQGPGFSVSRFFWFRVQGLGPSFRSSPFKDDPLRLRKYPVNMTGYSLLHL